jgi:long-subunit fatty acid transport protein
MFSRNVALTCLVLALALLPMAGQGQAPDSSTLNQTAPPSPVGSGARAMGTGGAFIAIADDATAANWNPAGLVQLVKPEMSLAFTDETRSIQAQIMSSRAVNYLSLVYPFSIGEVNVVTAVNYQSLYDFYFDSDFKYQRPDPPPTASVLGADTLGVVGNKFFYRAKDITKGSTRIMGQMGAISPALAFQITPALSVGFAYNFWRDGWVGPRYDYEYDHHREIDINSYTQVFEDTNGDCRCGGVPCDPSDVGADIDNPQCLDTPLSPPFPPSTQHRSSNAYKTAKINFEGENYNLGLLWKASARWTLGLVYRSEFEATLDYEFKGITYNRIRDGIPQPDLPIAPRKARDHMRFPASYGAGVAFRYSDTLTLTADATRIEWNRFAYEFENGDRISPVNGLSWKLADIDPTITYRLGLEYLFIQPQYVVPLRGGFFYDPEPAQGAPDDYYGISVGTGVVRSEVALDLTYWYRWGNNVTLYSIYDPDTETIRETKGDIQRQMLMLSAVIFLQ